MSEAPSRPVALVVDDDDLFRSSLAEFVRQEGHVALEAATLGEAQALLERQRPDLVLLDLELPDGRGLDLKLHGDPDTPFVVVSGDSREETIRAAKRQGAADYLIKPVDSAQLHAVLHALRTGQDLRREVSALRTALKEAGRFGRMIGASAPMREVYNLITRVAATSAPVLLSGESGTGKEVAALTIHEMSPRRDRPFVAVNCGAIPASLIESTLFGHEKGAFTGADDRHRGVFEQADGGTLFLDEIGEMPMELQVRLLRVLEQGMIRRIGGDQDITVDVRLIAATNRDPQASVEDGLIRQDLFHRLNVFPIHLPPLRERGEDARRLAEHFLRALNDDAGMRKRFGPGALDTIEAARWPGNVRELRNRVHRAWIIADDVIEARLLGDEAAAKEARPAPAPVPATSSSDDAGAVTIPVGTPLDEAERRLILATLDQAEGNKRKTARLLGISVKTLYARLKKYGEDTSETEA